MESAIFGLVGVILGAVLTVAREWWSQRVKDSKDAAFLAVQVVGQLDRFVAGCASVVSDDGLSEGRPDEQGYRRTQVTPPKFEPENFKVEWKSLPLELMFGVLDLPYKIGAANHSIEGAYEYQATPPDFEEFFEERQYQYALLGIEAARLSTALRHHAKLPLRVAKEWDPVGYMLQEKSKIEDFRQERALRNLAFHKLAGQG